MGAEIPDGAVLVARAIVNSSLWDMRPPDRVVAITCIVLANRRPRKWFDGKHDILIDRGQFVRSREQMVKACKLPLQVVRTSLEHLVSTDFLTRKPTRDYTLYTIPKYEHYQDLTKYSDNLLTNCGENQPEIQPDPNHKQILPPPHPPISSPIPNPSSPDRREEGTGGRTGDVVVVSDSWPDPLLAKPSFRISTKLLESVQMNSRFIHAHAAQKPVGQILRVVQQARTQKSPGGWAKIALDSDWKLPEASGDELREVIDLVKQDVERANAILIRNAGSGRKPMFERKPGETDDQLFKRVNDELKRRGGKNSARSEKRKGQG